MDRQIVGFSCAFDRKILRVAPPPRSRNVRAVRLGVYEVKEEFKNGFESLDVASKARMLLKLLALLENEGTAGRRADRPAIAPRTPEAPVRKALRQSGLTWNSPTRQR